MSWLTVEQFDALFERWEHSCWRWECQGDYSEPDESGPFDDWKAGHPDNSFLDPWLAQVRAWVAEGKTFARVRMLTDPLTEYLQWMITVTELNIAAGEDIRWITQDQVRRLEPPIEDFYLFDERLVATMKFEAGRLRGAEVTDEPAELARHILWRDRLTAVSLPHADVVQRSP
ncbi:DUF6879 family protein [Sciscionella sediminilitoris]|uniref:DUF6879 family protein n=1 Tax=Sciscionella sediminilitoris TaxID=1445613 RepID=UPI0004DF33E7|nr:DUF6879 family protein [Sciscionella sp. SE31]